MHDNKKAEILNLNRNKNYSGTALTRTPREHAKVSVLTSVRNKQVNCPSYCCVRIKRASVERGSTAQELRDFISRTFPNEQFIEDDR